MADFRKWLLAFAVAALLIGLGSSTAYAQGAFTCSTNAGAPTVVRAEGVAELVGDLILNCTGGIPTAAGQPIPLSNVQVTLNTNITSRIVDLASSASEGLILIDEPFPAVSPIPSTAVRAVDGTAAGQPPPYGQPTAQFACLANNNTNCAINSVGVGLGDRGSYSGVNGPGGTGNHYNVFQGTQQGQAIVWNGIPIDAPGTAGTRVIRITNVRANACLLGVSSTLVPTEIFELIGVNGSQAITINNPNQIVALVQPGLLTKVGLPLNLQQCTSVNAELLGGFGGDLVDPVNILAQEGFAYSFKPRNFSQTISALAGTYTGPSPTATDFQNIPGFQYHSESGFAPGALNGGTFINSADSVGQASQGTQIQLNFAGIGAGVNLFVPSWIALSGNYGSGPAGIAVLTPGGTIPAVQAIPGGEAGPLTQLTITGTTAAATYEVYYSDPSVLETLDVPVTIAYISNTANNLPATGTGTVAVNFAPLSSVPTASASAPIPRFCQPYTAQNLYTIAPCTCDLLFPFVTNQGGFDTGIALANTSLDPFGTTPQQGTVTLYYYGGTTGGGAAPPSQTTNAKVPAGQELIFTLSNGGGFGIAATPGFQGYIISIAQFQYCHAFAFISDVGAQRLAEGYLAISLDVPFNLIGTGAGAGNSRTLNFGENDGN